MKKLLLLLFSITVYFSFSQVTATFYIADGNDDVNEKLSHIPDFNQEFLKLGRTSDNLTLRIGLRYQNVTIPKGAEIISAHIQFTSSHDLNNTVEMRIFGEKSANAEPFENSESEIYLRPATNAVVTWTTQNWQAFIPGPDQKTSDLKEIIQEIVDQDGWASGNALHIKMYKSSFGSDSLMACAYEYMGDWYAPQLQVDYINWSEVPEQFENVKISIYPNPAADEFTLLFRNKEVNQYTITLFDITGNDVFQVHEGILDKDYHKLSISVVESGLQSGLYFLSINGGKKNIIRKIIVQ